MADRIERVDVDEEEINKYFHGVSRKLGWLSTEDILKRVLSIEFNRLLEYYKDAPNIDYVEEKSRKKDKEGKSKDDRPRTKEEKDRRTAEKGMARIYINVGKADGFYAGNLIDILNHNINGQRVDVGRIDLMPNYSLFDVKKGDAARVIGAIKGTDFMGKRLMSEIADPEKNYARVAARRSREAATTDDQRFEQFQRKGRGGNKKKSSRRKK